MFIGVTFIAADKKGEIKEIRAIVDTRYIRMIVEDKDHKDRCMITFNDETPSGLIKGSYEEISKLIFNLQRSDKPFKPANVKQNKDS